MAPIDGGQPARSLAPKRVASTNRAMPEKQSSAVEADLDEIVADVWRTQEELGICWPDSSLRAAARQFKTARRGDGARPNSATEHESRPSRPPARPTKPDRPRLKAKHQN